MDPLFLALNLLREFVGVVPATDATDLYIVLLVVFGKLVVEWSQFRAALTDDPSGFSSWFVPFDPREV
ncbi:hypothetical protein [Natrialba hulunbeirensis]|uniref:hypothetical protein n=1 Tax=Natrialba hulunbeirensis TaxID=123783 RepID=UPI000B01AEEB|nr:hypothetical protein [Natrialba hulunbeirensis]